MQEAHVHFSDDWGRESSHNEEHDNYWKLPQLINEESMKEFWERADNTKEQVNKISSRRNLAANGTDAILHCTYTQAPEQAAEYFHIIIKAIWIMIRIPTSWKIARTILLYKKNDPNIISNWRPVTITNTDYRIVMTHFARYMQHLNNTTAFISKQQKGFVNGVNGCAGHIFALQELMMHAQRTKQDSAPE